MHASNNIETQVGRQILCGLMWLLAWPTLVDAAPETKRMPESAPAIEGRAENQSEQHQGATEKSPLHVRIVQSKDEAASTEARERSTYQREQENLKAQVRSAYAAEKQVVITVWTVGFSVLGALGLFCTIWLSHRSVREASLAVAAANANTASLISAERAYVKMSILDPGIQWHEDDRQFYVKAKAQNFGRTPAAVTDTRIWVGIREHGDLLPTEFPYPAKGEEARHTGFLMPADNFMFEKHFPKASASPRQDSSKRLWVYGHVDYIALGNRYRSGFARLYEPILNGGERNILPVTEGQYDFDRARKPGEGDDW